MFGLSMGEFDDDLGLMSSHMNAVNMQMRSMNRLMNSLMPDPFNMLAPFDPGFQHQNALMERGQPMGGMGLFPAFPAMPNMNRLLSAGTPNGASFCSSSVISMSSGPDGRPQYYQATSSTKTGPGGVRETRKTVQDSRSGVKKMAIGHHIGERAHIIEKEQDLRSGQLEERQEFINLEEEEAEQFDREFTNRATRNGAGSSGMHMPRAIQAAPSNALGGGTSTLTIEPLDDSDDDEVVGERQQANQRYMPALPAPPTAPTAAPSQHNSTATETATTSKQSTELPTSSTSSSTSSSSSTSTSSTSSYSCPPWLSSIRPTPPSRTGLSFSPHGGDLSYYNLQNDGYMDRANNNYLYPVMQRSRNLNRSYTASPRRPLRTPPSSPLATAPTPPTPSAAHHHHPYNNAAATRRQQRKSHSQQQQQPQEQEQFHLQGVQIPTTSASQQQQQSSSTSRHSARNNATVAGKKNRH